MKSGTYTCRRISLQQRDTNGENALQREQGLLESHKKGFDLCTIPAANQHGLFNTAFLKHNQKRTYWRTASIGSSLRVCQCAILPSIKTACWPAFDSQLQIRMWTRILGDAQDIIGNSSNPQENSIFFMHLRSMIRIYFRIDWGKYEFWL